MAPKAKAAGDAPKKEKKVEKSEPREPRPEDLIPKVEKPDEKVYEERQAAVTAEIDKLAAKQKELGAKIAERTGGKDEYQTQRAALRAELDTWQAKIDEIKAAKDKMAGAVADKRQEGLNQKQELSKMRKAVGYTSVEEMDKRMADIEYQMQTSSMPLREEKKLVAELQALKKDRPKIAQIHGLAAKIDGADKGEGIRADMKMLSEQMGAMIEEKKKVSEKLKALSESRQNATGDLGEIFTQREELSTKIKDLMAKRNEIRAEKREKDNEFRAYQAEVRKVRQEQAAKEREERQKQAKIRDKVRKAEQLDVQPHTQEITLINQTIAFCKSFTDNKTEEKKEEKKEIAHNLDGVELLSKKEERADEYYFVPTAKKKSKSKGAKTSDSTSSKPIKHNAETFNLFAQLKLDAPISTADIPAVLEKLEAQLADYQAKVKEWEEKKEEQKQAILDSISDDEEEPKAEEAKEE